MNTKVVIVILAAACLGLGIALFAIKKQADDQHAAEISSLTDLSNQVVKASLQLKEKDQVNLTLSNQVTVAQEQVNDGLAKLAALSNSLSEANSTLLDTRTSLQTVEETVTNLNARIADLESQNKILDEQANSLSNQLAKLDVEIHDTRAKLAESKVNADFLKSELQKQLAQRAELEHKFNDLDELRAQIRRVKDELFVARRIQLMKYDTGNKKGAELLMMHTLPAPPASRPPAGPVPAYNLNVEVGSDGTVHVIPSTNSPAH